MYIRQGGHYVHWPTFLVLIYYGRPVYSICGHDIFILWLLLSFFFFFSATDLSYHRLHVYRDTFTHDFALVRI